MSSHHIVREKQEPALLVLGLENFSVELLGQLLEWSPTIITIPQTAGILIANGIKIDWLIDDGSAEVFQADVKLISAGDESLISTALEFLAGNEYRAVNIITDDVILHDYAHFTDKLDIVIFHNQKKIYAVNPGFSKWKPAGELIEVLSEANELEYNGLQLITENQYKTSHDSFFTLNFNGLFLFIAEDVV